MISITVLPADIQDGFKHIATEYQVATDEYFKNIIYSQVDEVYLYNKLVPIDVDLNVEYYVRARACLDSGGYTELSETHIVIPKEQKILTVEVPVPSVIEPPKLSVDESIDLHNVPLDGLTVLATGFKALQNVELESVTWMLMDMNGKIKISSIDDTENLSSFTTNYRMYPDTIYRVAAAFRGNNNNLSQFSMLTFTTGSE